MVIIYLVIVMMKILIIIGGKGKYGKGLIKTNSNNINYVEITDKGLHYESNQKYFCLKKYHQHLNM